MEDWGVVQLVENLPSVSKACIPSQYQRKLDVVKCTLVIPALGKKKQEFKAGFGYTVSSRPAWVL